MGKRKEGERGNLSFKRGDDGAGESVQFHFVFVDLFSVCFF